MNFEIEHDACGIGTVVQIDGKQSYDVLDKALHIVEKLEHRAGKDARVKWVMELVFSFKSVMTFFVKH